MVKKPVEKIVKDTTTGKTEVVKEKVVTDQTTGKTEVVKEVKGEHTTIFRYSNDSEKFMVFGINLYIQYHGFTVLSI